MKKIKIIFSLICSLSIIMSSFTPLFEAFAQTEELSLYNDGKFVNDNLSEAEAQKVFDFLKEWNAEFVENNAKIQSSSGDEKQYLTVKTIYNFIVNNTTYDYDVWQNGASEGYDQEHFRYAHSSYGALFGNIENADDYDMSYSIDPQGLAGLSVRNQGKSVCDGYSLVFYYLCQLNDIECKIVEGEYDESLGFSNPDPHAWNMVYLCDNDDGIYEWFYIDATFAEQKSNKLIKEFSVTDYSLFLRGMDNPSYSASAHQQLYDEFKSDGISSDDYFYELTTNAFDADSAYVIIDRRSNADDDVLESRKVLSPVPERKWYIIENNTLVEDSAFMYNGKEYYYEVTIPYLAEGIEIESQSVPFMNSGECAVVCKNLSGEDVINTTFSILPLNMGDLSSYDTTQTSFQDKEMFIGKDISVRAKIVDVAGRTLINGSDYVIKVYKESDSEFKNPVNPHDIGKYIVRVYYSGNYSGVFQLDNFEVTKTDLSKLSTTSVEAMYGVSLEAGCPTLQIGDTTVYEGKDYSVSVIGNRNYGDSGNIRITALNTSDYLQGGTYIDRKYTISSQLNVSSLFNGKYISNTRYIYTGTAIKPSGFTLSYTLNGKKVTLVKGTDYTISSYSNNAKAGTGYVNIKFIGNYTGTAQMKFYIDTASVTLSATSYTYSGLARKPSVTVKDSVGKTISASNYSVTYSNNTKVGTATAKVTFKGNYSGSISKTFKILPKNTSISSVTSQYKGFTVKLKKYTTQTTGYQIQYSTSSKFTKYKTVTLKNTTTSKTITGLTAKKKYYVRVRTYTKVGSTYYYSAWSGAKSVTTSLYPTTISLSATSYTYNGKVRRPTVTVKDNGKAVSSKYYTVTYPKGRKDVGTYTVTIKFKKPYSGTVKKTFTIKPKNTSISSVTAKSKGFTVKWKKLTTQTTGYQIQYSTSSNFANAKTVTAKKNSITSATVSKLSGKKKYYIRIRTYKKVSGKYYYSAWSKAKTVTTKK